MILHLIDPFITNGTSWTAEHQLSRCKSRTGQPRLTPHVADGRPHQRVEVVQVGGRHIRQITVLGIVPHLFNRIKIRGVTREALHVDPAGGPRQERLHERGPVDTPAFHDQLQVPARMPSQVSHEADEIGGTDVVPLDRPLLTCPQLLCHP